MSKNTANLTAQADIVLFKIRGLRDKYGMTRMKKSEMIVFVIEKMGKVMDNLDEETFIALSEFKKTKQ